MYVPIVNKKLVSSAKIKCIIYRDSYFSQNIGHILQHRIKYLELIYSLQMDSCHKVKLVLRTTSGNQFQQLKLRDLFKAPNITGSMKSKDYLKFSLDVLVGQVIKTFRQKE